MMQCHNITTLVVAVAEAAVGAYMYTTAVWGRQSSHISSSCVCVQKLFRIGRAFIQSDDMSHMMTGATAVVMG